MPKTKTVKIPKTLGACADRLYAIKLAIGELNHKSGELEAEAKAIKEHLIATLPKSDAKGVLGKVARVAVTTKQVAAAKDWDEFYKHVIKTKDFSLMQRRLSDAAIRERWDAGKKVPGVEPFTVVSVSVTKV